MINFILYHTIITQLISRDLISNLSNMSSYNEWVKNVSYGLKKVSQKNSIDFYMRNHSNWIVISDRKIREIENYTGKTFGLNSPRRSFTKWMNQLVESGIIITHKFNRKQYYRHSIFGSFISLNVIDENDSESDEKYSDSECKSESDKSEYKSDKSEDEYDNEVSHVHNMKKINSVIELESKDKIIEPLINKSKISKISKIYSNYNNYIHVSEFNLSWKRTTTQDEEEEEDAIREMELYDVEQKIMSENRMCNGYKSEFEFIKVITITSILVLFLTQTSLIYIIY